MNDKEINSGLGDDFHIIAGSELQAREYCKAKGVDYSPRRFFHAPHCLQGLRGGSIKLVGTYKQRLDWEEFSLMILEREFTAEHDDY